MADWMIGDSDDCISIVTEAANPSPGARIRVGTGLKFNTSSPPTSTQPGPSLTTSDVIANVGSCQKEPEGSCQKEPESSKPPKAVKRVTWKDDNLETCHYRRVRGARGTLVRSKSKMCRGRHVRYYTIGFYDMETGREEYASFSQKQLISDTNSLPDVDTSVIFDALRMMDTSVLCDGIKHTWIAENVRVIGCNKLLEQPCTNHEADLIIEE